MYKANLGGLNSFLSLFVTKEIQGKRRTQFETRLTLDSLASITTVWVEMRIFTSRETDRDDSLLGAEF
jgi:hypothetical protein